MIGTLLPTANKISIVFTKSLSEIGSKNLLKEVTRFSLSAILDVYKRKSLNKINIIFEVSDIFQNRVENILDEEERKMFIKIMSKLIENWE